MALARFGRDDFVVVRDLDGLPSAKFASFSPAVNSGAGAGLSIARISAKVASVMSARAASWAVVMRTMCAPAAVPLVGSPVVRPDGFYSLQQIQNFVKGTELNRFINTRARARVNVRRIGESPGTK